MIRCVVFDFDGTLVLSNNIKQEGFFIISEQFPDGPDMMKSTLNDMPGDRVAIFEKFVERLQVNIDVTSLVEAYGKWCEEKILACPERKGAFLILNELKENGIHIYVNSATPTEPLQIIIGHRYTNLKFDGVYGGHGHKVENLLTILDIEGIEPDELVMVGDGVDDQHAAQDVGCCFVGIAGGSLERSCYQGKLFDDFTGFKSILSDLNDNGKCTYEL